MKKKIKENIYFDHSATTPVDQRVLKEMMPYFSEKYGNYSSLHGFGREAYFAVEKAREKIASTLDCSKDEVIFTSGSTESNNLALKGVIDSLKGKSAHIITTQIEHDAILVPCKQLEKKGVEVTYLPVGKNGVVDPKSVVNAIKDNTVLISIMYVNNELGSINPIQDIVRMAKKKNKDIIFHTDATQAVNFLSCSVKDLGVDMMSISGHKIYGPKGVGLLFIRKGIPITPLQAGGHQERSIRSGTLNVPGIVGLGKAIELAVKEMDKNNKKISKLRDYFIKGVLKNVPDIILNTDVDNSVSSHANFCFVGAEGESILLYLDAEGIAVSTGSACASGSLEPSHVLLAIGIEKEIAHSSIRFTFGKHNNKEEIDYALSVLPSAIRKLRTMNPLYNK
ncbi:MAG: cysteine desulfurase family protein [Candidatus Pacebacteria bacterium]|nr:cysteine desulfurase family protein [Candidatus Paceibacterota bacterium]